MHIINNKNRIKRCLCIVTVIVLLMGIMSGCETKTEEQKSLYEQGMGVINLMSEMLNDDAYVTLYSISDEMKKMADEIGQYDYTHPKMVYQITLSEGELWSMSDLPIEGASQELKDYLNGVSLSSVGNLSLSNDSEVSLALSSIMSAKKTYVNKDLTENMMYLYTYESGYPIMVTFVKGEDNSLLASGGFVLNKGFQSESVDEIKKSFEGVVNVEVQEVTQK